MIRFHLIILGVLFNSITIAQSISDNIRFAKYLIENELYDDCIFLLSNIKAERELTKNQLDTLYFLMGKSYININSDSAHINFIKVKSNNQSLSEAASLYAAFLNIQAGSYGMAMVKLEKIKNTKADIFCNKVLQQRSVFLLQRKIDLYLTKQSQSPNICNNIAFRYSNLDDYYSRLAVVKKKSMLLSGLYSTIIPGLGRIYAGKPKQGIASFFPIAFLGIQAYEGYKVGGFDDIRFIIYGSLFSVFYVGNIWGSALAVKIKKEELYDKIDHEIIINLQIPLDQLFRTTCSKY